MSDNVNDIYNQGYYYYTGTNGFPLDFTKAVQYFQKAADMGHSDAMNYIGVFYRQGKCLPQNFQLAVNWYSKALEANPNNPYAAYNLGCMYYNGWGVAKNMDKAFSFCKKSVDLGIGNTHKSYAEACYLAGCILIEHYNNYSESYSYFIDASKYGDSPRADYNLGWLTEKGIIPGDFPNKSSKAARDSLARDYYKIAANMGMPEAMDAVGRIDMLYGLIDEARAYVEKAAEMGYGPAKARLSAIKLSQGGSIFGLFK